MAELNLAKIRAALKTVHFSDKDYLDRDELLELLSKLSRQPYDVQIFEQLWDQCTLNSKGQARISDFTGHCLSGESILLAKLRDVEFELIKNDRTGKPVEFTDQLKQKQTLDKLHQQKAAIQNSLSIIRRPFIDNTPLKVTLQFLTQSLKKQEDEYLIEYNSAETPETLYSICNLTLVLTFFVLIGSMYSYRFVDLLVCSIVLGNLLFETLNRLVIRFSFYLLLVSLVLDVVWALLYMDKFGHDPHQDLPLRLKGFMIVAAGGMTVVCLLLKVWLGYLFLSQFQLDELLTYSISVLGCDLVFQKESQSTHNPIVYTLNDLVKQPEQPESAE